MSFINLFRLILLSVLWSVSFLFLKLGASVFGAGILIEIRVFSAAILLAHYLAERDAKRIVMIATAITLVIILLVKTPLGDLLPIVKNSKS